MDMAQRITSVFENGDTAEHFDYVENLGDGRGFTCGVVGFTTGTGDALTVIEEYTIKKKNNPLAVYLPELRRISKLDTCDKGRADVSKLGDYAKAWKTAAKDPLFSAVQRDVVRGMYLDPARRFAKKANIASPFGIAIFYDTIIQHGWQLVEPDINLQRLMELTGPRGSRTEAKYLSDFLTTRRRMLCCYPDNIWPESASRAADLQGVLKTNNMELKGPIKLQAAGLAVKS
ncbi:glycoside hydrolase [Thamnocephalis sphaerospora]|uniref:Glycoside hydrolase n=1 Tax=Thamnocephalis sphaerospora TaxID=78915 RepID=A0A4P9XQN3_9FUNG|nr:glycoside hydrolase [Thamnocephalis sphaerospora]|eukprot:RKP08232.1 glycoside hydrolase [Thamnocephalis sphaerospora]